MALQVFTIVAREDQLFACELDRHLIALSKQGRVDSCSEVTLLPGTDAQAEALRQLTQADVVLLLVSADFLACAHCAALTKDALTEQKRRGCVVIPVLLRPCDWSASSFAHLCPVPRGRACVSEFAERDQAWLEVTHALLASDGIADPPIMNGSTPPGRSVEIQRPGLVRHCLDRAMPRLHKALTRIGTLAEPPELPAIRSYLGELKAQIEGDIASKIYLPLQGQAVPSAPLTEKAAATDHFVRPIYGVLRRMLATDRGGDAVGAQVADVSQRSRPVRNVLRLLLRSSEPLVLLGDPGSGKTMTMQQAAIALAASELRRVFPVVTVYVRLSEFLVSGDPEPEHVMAYIRRAVPPGLRPLLEGLDHAGRLVILLDGMDEMGRKRYGEHTRALSLFAGQRRGLTKTLFSCRVTDFSPEFVHRRLVLLPFDRPHIREYLRRYLPGGVIIDGQPWNLRALAQRLSQGNLTIDTRNPFNLWLLCLYLHDKRRWPASRTALLDYYCRQSYERCRVQEKVVTLPEAPKALRTWARLAYLIMMENKGAAIPVDSLWRGEPAMEQEIRALVRAGKRSGILAESLADREHQVRFAHHQFQEFFAALYIQDQSPAIDWLSRLDAPRWQETMLNLVQLGGADEAVATLASSIKEQVDALRGAPAAALPAAKQRRLADQVETGARLIGEGAAAASQPSNSLTSGLPEAIELLAERGSPLTQVKVMRACQHLTDTNTAKALQAPLRSSVQWVREQALMLVAARRGGADLPMEIALDLAGGFRPGLWPAYLKTVRTTGEPRHWLCLFAAVACSLLGVIMSLACAVGLYRLAVWSLAHLASGRALVAIGADVLLLHPASQLAFAGLVCSAVVLGLYESPRSLWAWAPGSLAVGLYQFVAGLTLWRGAWAVLYSRDFLKLLYAWFVLVVLVATSTGLLTHVVELFLYWAVAGPTRVPTAKLRALFTRSFDRGQFAILLMAASAGLVLELLHFGVFLLAGSLFERLLHWLGVWFMRALAIVTVLSSFGVYIAMLVSLWNRLRPRRPYRRSTFAQAQWLKLLKEASPDIQEDLLARTDANSIGLSQESFLLVLEEAEPLITDEPARSAYWIRLDQVEHALRLERSG